jgi:hypothetical protein
VVLGVGPVIVPADLGGMHTERLSHFSPLP